MSIVRDVDQSAFRRQLTHDLRASLFNIDGFVDELKDSLGTLEQLMDTHDLPAEFRSAVQELMANDLKSCLHCVGEATEQLQDRIDLLAATAETVFVESGGEDP